VLLQLLTPEEVIFCLDQWQEMQDGSNSQPLTTEKYDLKNNTESQKMPQEVSTLLTSKIYNNHYVDSVVCPSKVSVNFYNEYTEGGYYRKHVDSFKAFPKANNVFFDYGFTLCLDDEHEGGEFVLENEVGEIVYPLKRGQILIFPIIYPHSVNKVTSGSRKAIVGWMSSNVSYEQSYILKHVYQLNADAIKSLNEEMIVKSGVVQNYLIKHWST
tara:strand:+ start:849 stop:1490 length:642 start_codon:yes stop_codon:yes gene_type:complete